MEFKEFRAMAQNRRQADRFQEPIINRPDDVNWFVSYLYQLPHEKHPRLFKEPGQLRGFIGDQKEKEAEILRLDVLEWLQAGNSPYGNR